jgi:hypothetical protein
MVEIIILHCKCRFGTITMPTRIPPNLDMNSVVDQRKMKAIDAVYNVRMGYWA